MSTGSGPITGISTAAERRVGIPFRCWCGSSTIEKQSKSDANPYRRYYRCSRAAAKKLVDDNHIFKWVDDALVNEVEALHEKIGRLEENVKTMSAYMEECENLARIKVENEMSMKVGNEVVEKVESLIGDAKWSMNMGLIGVVVVCVIAVGMMKWIA